MSTSLANAKWTVMVYMNGLNDLEPYTIANFRQLANVGSTPEVNIVVELGRLGVSPTDIPSWEGVLRFRVERSMTPVPGTSLGDRIPKDTDMGAEDSLRDFITWTYKTYPADHYILIMGAHGQGYRLHAAAEGGRQIGIPTSMPFRTISKDDKHGSKLYMRDVEDALLAVNAAKDTSGFKLDVFGFDSCLMAMVETAYAIRNVALTMVASQEIEPGTGWKYDDWLSKLIANPSMTAQGLASSIVAAYKDLYGNEALPSSVKFTTLSATSVTAIVPLASSISNLSQSLIAALDQDLQYIKAARSACLEYGRDADGPNSNDFHDVDLGCFTTGLLQGSHNANVRVSAQAVITNLLRTAITSPYAGSARAPSSGLCIYFPATGADYTSDGFAENGYERSNDFKPVDFVKNEDWTLFLHEYFKRVPS